MKRFLVNKIINESHLTMATVGSNKAVLKNLDTMLGKEKTYNIVQLISNNEDFYFIERFCQFIGIVNFKVKLSGFSMTLLHFNGKIDNALDEYPIFKECNWNKEDIDKIVRIFDDIIQDNNPEQAELVEIPLHY